MSNEIFPELRGQEWPVSKIPAFRNIINKTIVNNRRGIALTSYPIWTFKVGYEFLTDTGSEYDDIHKIMGFFLRRQGNLDDFLFYDKTDNFAMDQVFGIADGEATQFQLVRSYGGYIEPIFGLRGTPIIKANGVQVNPTVTAKGKVIFSYPPADNTTLSWTGGFCYRVAFLQPESEFENFMQGLWQNKSLEFESVKSI